MSIADKYRNQLETIHFENDVFAIIDDMLQEMEELHAELESIHDVIMCIAEAKPSEDDTYTVREVKQLAIRVKELQQNEQS